MPTDPRTDQRRREVTVLRYADRHAELHSRGFAEVRTLVVRDDDPVRVVEDALGQVDLDLGGRFAITVEEPHDSLVSDEERS